jgi:hypothetical protein
MYLIGNITNSHGIRGEVKIYNYSDFNRFFIGAIVFVMIKGVKKTFEIERVRGIKNMVFGGEGIFFAKLSGQGKVWLQTLPISRLASRIIAYAPQSGGTSKEEGSILGGIGRLIDGN